MTYENSWQTYENYEDEIKLSYDSKKEGVWVSEGTEKLLFVPRNMVLNMFSELDNRIEEQNGDE
ncbi:hypothetical protein N9924_00325 [bacterium]|nr:hypothetical protein [bacterium]